MGVCSTVTADWWRLLAVYNGERRGGTAATVRYARKLGRGIIILNPITLEVTEDQVG